MQTKKFQRRLIYSLVVTLALTGVNVSRATEDKTFSDISGHQNATAVGYLQENALIQGYADGTYQPERLVNRAEFLKVVIRALPDFSEETLNNCTKNYFSDVERDAWYAPYICYGKEKGLIGGYPDGTFRPNQLINFAEASKIIANGQNLKSPSDETLWYKGYVKSLQEKNAIPTSVQTFGSNLSRGEMAEVLWRLMTQDVSKTSKGFYDLVATTDALPQIQSCAELQERLQTGASKMAYSRFTDGLMVEDMALPPEATQGAEPESNATKSAESGAPAEDYSQTNVQVEGVDEADIIKNDGKYIYLIKGNTVRILEAYPPENLKEIAKITLDDTSFSPQEIYADEDQMVIIGQTYRQYEPLFKSATPEMMPYYGSVNRSKVYVYNLTDRKNPQKLRSVEYEGDYNTSRKIGKNLYLVINKPSYFYGPWVYAENVDASTLVPRILDSAGGGEKMAAGCAQIHYFPHYTMPNYLIVSAFDISQKDGEIAREVYLGASDNIFASLQNLYVATASFDEVQTTQDDNTFWQRQENTLLYRFALNGPKIEFTAQGKAPGRILNQFSMDEYQDYFRIATTSGEIWNDANPSSNNLYVLDQDLATTGKIEGIAPGERIYSVRFLGKRGFMVTFKTVDPLFVMDLSDPAHPVIAGKLKIPGWSDYLHPYDENHLIGFGKEVDESIDADKVHSESAVYYTAVQGMKLSLFDISDLNNPKEMFKEVIGARDTTSELLTNHKALLFDKEKELLAFPITVTEDKSKTSECAKYTYSTCPSDCALMCLPSVCNGNGACTQDCADTAGSCIPKDDTYGNIQTVFQGAYVYTVNLTDGFKLRGKVTHYTDPDIFLKSGEYFYGEYDKQIKRIIYIGDYLYSISEGVVKALTMDKVEEKAKVELE